MSRRTLVLTLVIVLSILLLTSFTYAQLNSTLRVCLIDVGQGDSILMSTSGGTHVLVDAGQPWAGPTVVAYLQTEGIEHIDVVVMSHGHADHIGGLIELFRSDISIGSVVYNGQPCTTATCGTVWAEMEKRKLTPTPAVVGQTHTWGELDVEISNPKECSAPPGTSSPYGWALRDEAHCMFTFVDQEIAPVAVSPLSTSDWNR